VQNIIELTSIEQVDAKGILDIKKISADFGVSATDAEWKKLVPAVINRCSKEATGKYNHNFTNSQLE
jgi:hypothetical protein